MKNKILLGIIIALGVIAACTRVPTPATRSDWMTREEGQIKVLATTAMVGDLVTRIGGCHVDVEILIQGDIDPHAYELRKGDAEKFDRADVIFYNGLGLEHGASLYSRLQGDSKGVAVGDTLLQQSPASLIYVDHTVDPHIWMDLQLWAQLTDTVGKTLACYKPEEREFFLQRSRETAENYLATDRQILTKMQAIPAEIRYLVTSHDAFHYYGKRYLSTDEERESMGWQHRVSAPEGLAPEGQVGVVDIQNIIQHLVRYNISTVFPESNVSRDALKKVIDACRQQGMEIQFADEPLYGDSLGSPIVHADTLEKMVLYNSHVIYTHLMGEKNKDE